MNIRPTDAASMKKSRRSLKSKRGQILPSERAAACLSETPTETTSSVDDRGAAIIILAAVLYEAMRSHPTPDMWKLAWMHASEEVIKLGVTKKQYNRVIEKTELLFQHAEDSSPWPKGFF